MQIVPDPAGGAHDAPQTTLSAGAGEGIPLPILNSTRHRPTFGAIGVARGCSGCTCIPQSGENFFRPNLQEKCESAPPGHEVHPNQCKSEF